MGAVCKLIRRRSMARGAALARCRVTDPLQIDSHTVPSQHTCHVRWRGLSEVRRKLHVLRAFAAAAAATTAIASLLPTRPRISGRHRFPPESGEPFFMLVEKEPRRRWSCKDPGFGPTTWRTLHHVTEFALPHTCGF